MRVSYLLSFLCCGRMGCVFLIFYSLGNFVFDGGSVVLTFLVFCVVVFGVVRGAHLFSFLCCGIWWGPWYSSF